MHFIESRTSYAFVEIHEGIHIIALLLTWFNFNPSMDKYWHPL